MTKDVKKIFLKMIFLILYLLAAVMALSLGKHHGETSIIWTPMGIGLSIVYYYGLNLWPFLFLGMLIAGIFVKLTLITAFTLALIHTGIILLTVNFLRKTNFNSALESIQDVTKLIIPTLLGSFLEIIITMAILPYHGIETWLISWLGEFVGVITVAPMLLTWNRKSFKRTNSNFCFLETLLLIILTGLISYLVINNRGIYLLFPCLIWVALRHGTFGASFTVFLIIAIFTTRQGFQGFQKGNQIRIELAAGVISLTSMFLAAAVARFLKVRNDLKSLNESLELRVAERTEELLNEIAAKRAIEKVIFESEAKYRELFETSLDGIVVADIDGNFIDCNRAYLNLLGYRDLSELQQTTIWDITPLEYHEIENFQFQEKVLARSYSDEFEKKYICKNGEYVIVSVRIWLRPKKEGSREIFWAIVRDITERKRLYNFFKQTERNFRSIIENSQDGIILLDGNGKIAGWNPGLEKITGFSKADVLGRTYWEVCSRLAPNGSILASPEQLKEYLPALLRENQNRIPEIRIKRLDGSERVIHLLTFIIKSNVSTMVGGIIRDVTEQILTKQSMINYAERLKVLYEIDHDILRAESLKELSEVMMVRFRRLYKYRRVSITIYRNDAGSVLLSVDFNGETRWGPGAQLSPENYQVPKEFASGKEFLVDDLSKRPDLPKVYQDMVKEGIKSYLSLPLIAQGELIGSINFGSESPGNFTQEIIRVTRQIANHFAIAIYQARLHEQLGENREQLRQLAQRLVLAQEGERHHLSRELHDDAGQELTALKIILELISQDLPPEHPQLRSWLEESINLTNMALETIRSLAQGLRPPALDAVGLGPALEELCNDFSRRAGLRLKYRGDRIPLLAEPLNICLYRVLQEALTNIAKHARADEVEVQLLKDGEIIYLGITDDGVGFNQNSEDELNRKGIGLIGMQERLEALGGSLQIQTGEGEGTRIIAIIPWEGVKHDKSIDCR